MTIVLLIILLIVVIWSAYNTYSSYKEIKKREAFEKTQESMILHYQNLLKGVNENCHEGLSSSVLINARHELKKIRDLLDKID